MLVLLAIGGMGKSAVAWKWFHDIAPQELPALSGRVWWSFYETDARFDNFVLRTLGYITGRPVEELRTQFVRAGSRWVAGLSEVSVLPSRLAVNRKEGDHDGHD